MGSEPVWYAPSTASMTGGLAAISICIQAQRCRSTEPVNLVSPQGSRESVRNSVQVSTHLRELLLNL